MTAHSQTPTTLEGVQQVDPTSYANWDAELEALPGATFFHGSSWARALKDTYGLTPVYLVARSQGRIHSVLPLMEADSVFTGRRGVSLPFTDECAPLCADGAAFDALYHAALGLAKLRRWKYLELRGGLSLLEGASPSVSFMGHRLDLRPGVEALFNGCESSNRRALRKAEQSGVSIEFSTELGAVRAFYALLCKTRRRHGVPPQPFRFFARLHQHVLSQGKGWVVLARSGNTPIAGAVYFHYGKTAIYKFGASDEAFQQLRANNLVMWEAIKRYANDAFEVLDFGRSSLTNSGLQKFKLSWGSAEHRIDYVRHDCRTGRFAVIGDAASSFPTRVLGLLPGPVFNLVGSLAYRHMA